jgi:hypothetical protein
MPALAALETPVLADFERQLDAADEAARRLVDGLSEVQARWKPVPKRWSILECLEHIAASAERYANAMDRAVARGRPASSRAVATASDLVPLYGPVSRWLVMGIEPPPKVRIKTGRAYVPRADRSIAETLDRYLNAHAAVRERLRAAEGLDLVHTWMSHPSLRLFRFSLGAGFGITTGHARRHLWQAEQVRKDPAFPHSG